MSRWKPGELLINNNVRSDPVVVSVRRKLGSVPSQYVPDGRSTTITKASRILNAPKANSPKITRKSKKGTLRDTIERGKKVLYLAPAGKAVEYFEIDDKRMACPEFAKLKWANNGCYFHCDWCFLKATYRANMPYLTARAQYEEIERQLERKLQNSPGPVMFNSGELADSLGMDHVTNAAAHFISWFGEQKKKRGNGYLFLLTKSDQVGHILGLPHNGRTIIAWSLNAPDVSRRFEKGAPSFQRRLEAARQCQEAGYQVRVRLDPIVPVPGWEDMYADAISKIYPAIKPERITLGTLRFEKKFFDNREHLVSKALLDHMKRMGPMFTAMKIEQKNEKTKTSSGKFSFPEDERIKIFTFAKKEIRKHSPRAKIALCKESAAVWQAVGLDPSRCRCVCQLDYANMEPRRNGMYVKTT